MAVRNYVCTAILNHMIDVIRLSYSCSRVYTTCGHGPTSFEVQTEMFTLAHLITNLYIHI